MTTTLFVRPEPTDSGRFLVLVRGWLEEWTIEEIKAAVARGDGLETWGVCR